MKCPECKDGKIFGFACLRPVSLPCPRCKSTGEVPDIQTKWMKSGEEIKRIRRDNGMGLTAGAKYLGIKPSELSEYERGMKNPIKIWKLLLKKGNK